MNCESWAIGDGRLVMGVFRWALIGVGGFWVRGSMGYNLVRCMLYAAYVLKQIPEFFTKPNPLFSTISVSPPPSTTRTPNEIEV